MVLKGSSSQKISISSLMNLQEAYLEYSDKYFSDNVFINPNNQNDIFTDYHFMLSMNGSHGLDPIIENIILILLLIVLNQSTMMEILIGIKI